VRIENLFAETHAIDEINPTTKNEMYKNDKKNGKKKANEPGEIVSRC
jgi:hypothetical protein